ncbi:MAG: 3-oxoacyl-[acyl-carrier protein] reductase (EC [uncultured Sulfurovum sp.]|uniref:3-oxoacyl-[acyl-carrier protein] reductase (EC) n=1 Tax=uncultured Sulfurovum sp. TaxID=269237 RepID=A0A6S6RVY8_9BACT|nr:MAG: 3-oxoacyl-[acyl-carrier protein] reductase (EC [uncultured Sulfurovum sp.]
MKISIIQQSGDMNSIYSIKGKVIILTGATGYLGSKMVEHLTLAGAKVMILATNLNKSKSLCQELAIPENQAFEIDVSDKGSVKSCFKMIYNRFGKIDVLINNAYFGVAKTYNSYSKEEWHKSFDGTVISMDTAIQEVLPYMKKNIYSSIINISSMYGMVCPNPEIYPSEDAINPLSYGVGKAGVIQYTKYLAMSLAKYNISVNTISYGPFPNTDIVKDETFLKNLANKTFVKRIGKPEEVTSAVYFLSLNESSFITGQNIVVDGGWTSW